MYSITPLLNNTTLVGAQSLWEKGSSSQRFDLVFFFRVCFLEETLHLQKNKGMTHHNVETVYKTPVCDLRVKNWTKTQSVLFLSGLV